MSGKANVKKSVASKAVPEKAVPEKAVPEKVVIPVVADDDSVEDSVQDVVENSAQDVVENSAQDETVEADGEKLFDCTIPQTMVKAITEEIGEKSVTKDLVKRISVLLMKNIVQEVASGKTVQISNYMTFKRAIREERNYKIPTSDGATVTKPKHHVMTMHVKPALKKYFEKIT